MKSRILKKINNILLHCHLYLYFVVFRKFCLHVQSMLSNKCFHFVNLNVCLQKYKFTFFIFFLEN